jgi:regulatory protein
MTLVRISALGQDGSRVMLHLSDGTKLRVPTTLVADFGLYGGLELTEDDLASLQEAASQASARARAVRIVSTTSISKKSLQQRLIQRGESPQDAAQAVDYLQSLGALDDRAVARQVVNRCLQKGYGEARIRQELYAKGVGRELWEEALAQLPDMGPAIDRFLARRFRGAVPDAGDIQKAAAALQRRGHRWEDISQALRRYQADLEAPL